MSRPLYHDLWQLLKELFASAVFGMVWILALGAFTEFSPAWAGAYGLFVLALFVFVHIVRSDLRTRATVRLRPLRSGWNLIIGGASVELLITVSSAIWRANHGPILSGEPGSMETFAKQPGGFLVAVMMAVVVAPLLEEFIFRGWIQGAIERQFGPLIAVPAAALAFAFMHSGAEWPVFKFASGCFYGATIWATRSIWSSVALHAAGNLTVTCFLVAKRVGDIDPKEFFHNDFYYVSTILLMGSALAIAVWMIGTVKRRKSDREGSGIAPA